MQPSTHTTLQTVLQTAVAAGTFKTLTSAVKAAGLVDTLEGAGPFTVFAPTDEAFAKLPKATLEGLMRPESKQKLKDILTYHVVPSKIMATQVKTMHSAKSVQGGALTISQEGGQVKIGAAKLTKADIVCSNGVIHIIDTVLLPT